MKISVITVCRNSEKTIGETIESVAVQDYPHREYIVVDGKSTDDTMSIINDHRSTISTVLSEPDGGIYDAMNKGLRLATGDVIGFLNSDDVYVDSSVLSSVAKAFAQYDVDACYGDLIYVDKGDTSKVVRYWRSGNYQPGLFRRGWMPAHPTFFVRREIYEKYGGFDVDYKIQSDFELTMRFLDVHGVRSVYLPVTMIRMRMGGVTNNSMLNVVKGNIEAYRACKKHNMNVTPLFFFRKILSRVPQFFVKPGKG